MDTLLTTFLESASRHAQKVGVRDPRRELTYGQFVVLVEETKRLIEAGTDRPNVGLLLPASVEFGAGFYGCLWADKVAVPLNSLLKPTELASIVHDAGIDLIVTCSEFEEVSESLATRVVFLDRVATGGYGSPSRTRRSDKIPKRGPDDLAVILYTSGTTGLPRGVCLSDRNLLSNAFACGEHLRLNEDATFLGVLPLSHSFGLTTMLILPTLLGASVQYHARFQPAEVVGLIAKERVSVLMATASMFTAMARAKSASAEVFRNLAMPVSGGEALPQAVFRDYQARFGLEILQGYGLTETSPVVSVNQPWAHRPGTVGRPIPSVEVAIKDDAAQTLPPGSHGEICIRGPNVMRGYYERPKESAEAFTPDGWLRTGDLGRMDEDGFTTITGRKKELIIVAGENVFPHEVESVLDRHPAVAESAVVGVPDARRGEAVVAFVVPKEDVKVTPLELREHCRSCLAGFKVPRHIIIDSELPRGPTGKILKRMLYTRIEPGAPQ